MSVKETASQVFGFGEWKTGLGLFGNLFLWLFIVIVICAIGGFFFYLWYSKKLYSQKIRVFGMVGNSPQEKNTDFAKIIRVGHAGDKLFFLKKAKRHIPYPTIQSGVNTWFFWEREDNELINFRFDNLDMLQKKMGIKFVDTDMRMQRLGIEKLLSLRHQDKSFWEKYGHEITQGIFYVLVTILLIVLFVQWRKTGSTLEAIASNVAGMGQKCAETGQHEPTIADAGLIPALALFFQVKYHCWRAKK